MLGPLLSALLAVSVALPAPAPIPSCAAEVAADAQNLPRPDPAFLPPDMRSALNWRALGADYVACEVSRGRVSEILVLQNEYAVATMLDGSYVEFPLPEEDSGWFLASASDSGVLLAAGSEVEFPSLDQPRPGSAAQSGSSGKTILVWFCLAAVPVVYLWRRRRRRRKVAVHKVASSNSPAVRPKSSDIPQTKFSDVAGCKEAIEDLAEMVDVLKNPEKYQVLGAKAPRGALLVGPPGTGKTLLARAVAGEAEVPFFSAAGSDFVEMYVGVGARRVRDVFDRARKAGKAIVFIDELDAVGRRRSDSVASGGEQELENTLIALLNELDGFASSQVVVLAATNRSDILDPALTRPGRLDRKIFVPLPDVVEREAILAVHSRGKKLSAQTDLSEIARRTPGMSGAQLEQVCNEAALLAARTRKDEISQVELRAAAEYVQMGRARRSATVSEEDRKVTAWHEAGHTVAALKQPNATRPVAVSITPRGLAGGVTLLEGDDSQITSRTTLRARLVVALAGRAAEEILLGGEHTAGAANDLEQATQIARLMVERFGMTDLGLAVRAESSDSQKAVDSLVNQSYAAARELLAENHSLLESIAAALMEKSDLTASDIAMIEHSVLSASVLN